MTKFVCLARPRGQFDAFDLIITTPQYRLAAAPNILEVTLPLTSPPAAPPTEEGQGLALLVGGTSPPYVIDGPAAAEMASSLKHYAADRGLRISGTTSARTGREATAVLAREFAGHAGFHVWEQGKPNPYADILSGSQEIIVTEDSVSMVADALAAGKRVSVYPLTEQWGLGHRLVRKLWSIARKRDGGLLQRLLWPLFDSGLLEARADRKVLHQALVAQGLVAWFGEGMSKPDASLFTREMQAAVARVRALFDQGYS
jgi:mitochondrial fission protein ELM1